MNYGRFQIIFLTFYLKKLKTNIKYKASKRKEIIKIGLYINTFKNKNSTENIKSKADSLKHSIKLIHF